MFNTLDVCCQVWNMSGFIREIGNGGLQVNGENNTSIVTKDPIERDGIPWLVDTTNEAFKHIHKNVYIYTWIIITNRTIKSP